MKENCDNNNIKFVERGGALVEFTNFQLEGRGFDYRSSRHVGTLGKFFTYSCLCARPLSRPP